MSKIIDLTGQKFNNLTVVSLTNKRQGQHPVWLCLCDCGSFTYASSTHLKTGHTKRCKHCNREQMRINATTHGASFTSEHNSWCAMKGRCLNSKNPAYKDYGGRGITVCPQWIKSFETFSADMGLKPSPSHSLDRIDNNKGYNPSNCRWATSLEQNNNTRQIHPFYATSPIGRRYIAKSRSAFAREHGLTLSRISEVLSKKYTQHKGWTFQPL